MEVGNAFEPYAKKRKLDDLGGSWDAATTNIESHPRSPATPIKDLQRKSRRDDDENSISPTQAVTHPVLLDQQMACRLFDRPLTKKQFDKLKVDLQSSLQDRLKQLSKSKQTCEDVLEMADSAYVLMLLNPSNPKGEEAGRAIMLIQEGVRLITHGQDLLKSAFSDLFTVSPPPTDMVGHLVPHAGNS